MLDIAVILALQGGGVAEHDDTIPFDDNGGASIDEGTNQLNDQAEQVEGTEGDNKRTPDDGVDSEVHSLEITGLSSVRRNPDTGFRTTDTLPSVMRMAVAIASAIISRCWAGLSEMRRKVAS